MKTEFLLKLPILLSVILLSLSAYGERLTFAGLSLEVPDTMKWQLYDNGVLSIVGSDCAIYLSTLGDPEISDKVNFDDDEIFKDLDRKLLPIDKYYSIQSVEKNDMDIYYPNINVRKKYIAHNDSSDIFLTQTFYTPKRPYVAAVNYFGPDCPAVFDDIMGSVDDGSSFFSRQWEALKEGAWTIIVWGLVAAILSHIIGYFCNRDKYAVRISLTVTVLITTVFFILFPNCILTGILVSVFSYGLGWFGANSSFSEFLESILKEI